MMQRRTYGHLVNILVTSLLLAQVSAANATVQCEQLFTSTTAQSSVQAPVEVRDLKTLGQAMTQGMTLNPEQADLFEVYRNIYFGDSNTSVKNETLKSVTDILTKNPNLEKPHFPE